MLEFSGRGDRVGTPPLTRTRPPCGYGPTQHGSKDAPLKIEDSAERMGSTFSIDKNPFRM